MSAKLLRSAPDAPYWSSVTGPDDLKAMSSAELDELAVRIRELLVSSVAEHGGHLGPNLGVVELTMAIHRVFDSPRDPVIFDTGHQAYVHKIVTGRAPEFARLRSEDGLSGYPARSESPHDWVENSHASTSLSWADGLARAKTLRGEDGHVVAVIGDGALTGGMAWEALNNIASDQSRRVVVVVNDNGRSYTPTVGGLANKLNDIRTHPQYESTLAMIKERLTGSHKVGEVAYEALHAIKKGIKDVLAPQRMFEDLGLKYLGPVDGHNREALEQTLLAAKQFNGPVMVHAITTKGQGYDIAVANENDQMHQSNPFDPATGRARSVAPAGWTSVFRDELVRIADERSDIVAITAAMLYPTGLDAMADKFPERVFDVGIAEQHALTCAAGLAAGGMHPVVAVYATFANRAFDQLLLDVGLHDCGVTLVLDRAGVTGDDGASHNGMWDLSLLSLVPNISIAAPRDGARLRELLREAVAIEDAPSVVRFAKGAVADDIEAMHRIGAVDVLSADEQARVLIVGIGTMASTALATAELLAEAGIASTVVDPRWVKPLDRTIVELAAGHEHVVVLEDNGRQGGVGASLTQMLADAGVGVGISTHAIPQVFLEHAKRDVILERIGLTAPQVARATIEIMKDRSGGEDL